MKVLIVHWLYEPNFLGGGERIVQTLAEGLVVEGHEVVVVTTVPGWRTSIASIRGVKVPRSGQYRYGAGSSEGHGYRASGYRS
jgi:hypothetical protein